MKYFIDGYNLLFKEAWARSCNSLEDARRQLIQELDSLATTLRLDITVVFDAPFQDDELRRGHFRSLEIVFTAKGQTADDYLAHIVEGLGTRAVVVTSDRGLKRRIKDSRVENVHEFIVELRKKSRKKAIPKPVKLAPTAPKIIPKPEKTTLSELPPLGDLVAWEAIFTGKIKLEKNKTKRPEQQHNI